MTRDEARDRLNRYYRSRIDVALGGQKFIPAHKAAEQSCLDAMTQPADLVPREVATRTAGMKAPDTIYIAPDHEHRPYRDQWFQIRGLDTDLAYVRADISVAHCKQIEDQKAEIARLRQATKDLMRAYVNLMETGRDRIIESGGQCDPVDVMERRDPYLRQARDAMDDCGLTAASTIEGDQP